MNNKILILLLIVTLFSNCAGVLKEKKGNGSTDKLSKPLPLLQVNGLDIVDSKNNKILLRGLCVNPAWCGHWVENLSEKLEADGSDPLIRPVEFEEWILNDNDFEEIKKLGANVVRFQINYELFATDNKYRDKNVEKLRNYTKKFNKIGAYVIITLQGSPGRDVQNEDFELIKTPDKRMKSIFESDLFWNQFITMWQYLAKHFKSNPGIAGYELISEPFLPCEKDGGIVKFQKKLDEMYLKVREIDKNHIILIPEYNAREANPGEKYWDDNLNKEVIDNGFQGTIWEQKYVPLSVDFENLIYVFHFFEPWSFVAEGDRNYNKEKMVAFFENRVKKGESLNAPLFVTSHGINWKQPIAKRVKWLRDTNSLFEKYNLSSIFYEYKSPTGSWDYPFNMGLFLEYVLADEEITIRNGKYKFQDGTLTPAIESGFEDFFKKYLWKSGKIEKITLGDGKPLWDELHRYFKHNR